MVSNLCTLHSPSFPEKLSPSYLHGFLSVHSACSLSPGSSPMLRFSFSLLRHKGQMTKRKQTPCQMMTILQPRTLSHACPIAQRLGTIGQVLGAQFFAPIALMEFALKKTCRQLCIFRLAPFQQSSPQALSYFHSFLSVRAACPLTPSYFHAFLSASPMLAGSRLVCFAARVKGQCATRKPS